MFLIAPVELLCLYNNCFIDFCFNSGCHGYIGMEHLNILYKDSKRYCPFTNNSNRCVLGKLGFLHNSKIKIDTREWFPLSTFILLTLNLLNFLDGIIYLLYCPLSFLCHLKRRHIGITFVGGVVGGGVQISLSGA